MKYASGIIALLVAALFISGCGEKKSTEVQGVQTQTESQTELQKESQKKSQAESQSGDENSAAAQADRATIMVRLNDGVSAQELQELIANHKLELIKQFEFAPLYHFRLPAGVAVNDAIEALSSSSLVSYAEPNIEHKSNPPAEAVKIQ